MFPLLVSKCVLLGDATNKLGDIGRIHDSVALGAKKEKVCVPF